MQHFNTSSVTDYLLLKYKGMYGNRIEWSQNNHKSTLVVYLVVSAAVNGKFDVFERFYVPLVTDILTTWVEAIGRVKWIVFTSQLCCKSGSLKVMGQFSHDSISCKTLVKFATSHWSVLVSFNPYIVGQINLVW